MLLGIGYTTSTAYRADARGEVCCWVPKVGVIYDTNVIILMKQKKIVDRNAINISTKNCDATVIER